MGISVNRPAKEYLQRLRTSDNDEYSDVDNYTSEEEVESIIAYEYLRKYTSVISSIYAINYVCVIYVITIYNNYDSAVHSLTT